MDSGSKLNRRTVIGVIIVASLLVAWIVLQTRSKPKLENQRYFLDLGSGLLFPGDRFALPPIDAPSGPGQGVAAVVFGCGGCDDPSARVTAWLETLTDEAKAIQPKLNADPESGQRDPRLQERFDAGSMVALPVKAGETPAWVVSGSPQGNQLRDTATANACPGGGRPVLCLP